MRIVYEKDDYVFVYRNEKLLLVRVNCVYMRNDGTYNYIVSPFRKLIEDGITINSFSVEEEDIMKYHITPGV